MSETPNYYAIIPADVRYAKIKANAKLLYGEITCLTNKTGFCFASNSYFANLYWVSEKQVSIWINELKKNWFIYVEIKENEGNKRLISIHQKVNRSTPKGSDPMHQKVIHNNTSNNNKNNNINIISPNGDIAYGNQEINQIFEIVKKYNNWISDDLWKWRIFWNHLLKKLKKIDKVENWQFTRNDYLVWILEIVSKNSYHQHKIASVQKIYYNLAELIQIANADYLKTKKNTITEF